VSAETGRASFGYIQAAIDAALRGDVAAVATAPINKEAIHAAGINFPGHTEMFAARCESARWCMMQYSPEITCTFVTVHVGYAEVPHLLTTERILDVIQLSADGLRQLRNREPKIVVCGLNPHAGEHGLFGNREEERIIIPAIEAARRQGLQVEGPLPPDTAFLPWKRKETDVFVCMYHDQGHIPVKALAFDSAVNTTLGLPIIRTSVDHGTACDIAWQGKARPDSLFAALRLAAKLAPLRAAAAQES
jgi:4-hydroxythreonine-4-phosphate dehydrogenase